jgi:NAD-dependent dihydropyrimidine dehydrogenase PreA subunit
MAEELWFGIPREEIEWFPTINYDKCVSCMACLNKCTHGVYAEDNRRPKVVNKMGCVVGCTGCQKVCAQGAISHPSKEYLKKLSKRKDFKIGCECGGN